MAMNERIKNIWKDPVLSKVIAAAIIAAAGVLYSLVKSWLNENVSLEEAFKTVFSFQVNLWLAIAVVIMVLIIVGVIKKIKANKQRVSVPPFVNDFTRGMYQNQVWKWRWVWSPTHKFYYVNDLNIECPNCHDGVLDLEYMNYRCPSVMLHTSLLGLMVTQKALRSKYCKTPGHNTDIAKSLSER